MAAIFSSWVVSPLLAGLAVSVLYLFMRTLILRSKHAFVRAFATLPLFVGATFGLISGFIAQTGGNNGAVGTKRKRILQLFTSLYHRCIHIFPQARGKSPATAKLRGSAPSLRLAAPC